MDASNRRSAESRSRDCRLVEALQSWIAEYESDGDLAILQRNVRGLSTSLEGDADPRLRAAIPDLSSKLDLWVAIDPGRRRVIDATWFVIAQVEGLCDES